MNSFRITTFGAIAVGAALLFSACISRTPEGIIAMTWRKLYVADAIVFSGHSRVVDSHTRTTVRTSGRCVFVADSIDTVFFGAFRFSGVDTTIRRRSVTAAEVDYVYDLDTLHLLRKTDTSRHCKAFDMQYAGENVTVRGAEMVRFVHSASYVLDQVMSGIAEVHRAGHDTIHGRPCVELRIWAFNGSKRSSEEARLWIDTRDSTIRKHTYQNRNPYAPAYLEWTIDSMVFPEISVKQVRDARKSIFGDECSDLK